MSARPTKQPETKLNNENKTFEQAIRRLKSKPDISDEDRTNTMNLVDHLLARDVGKLRVVKYINHLTVAARIAMEIARKPLGRLDRKGIEAVVSRINTEDYTERTKHDYKIIIRKYFQWIRSFDEDQHQYPPEVAWIKTTLKKKRLLPQALLSRDERPHLYTALEIAPSSMLRRKPDL
jgi:site-specific recombinase XerD